MNDCHSSLFHPLSSQAPTILSYTFLCSAICAYVQGWPCHPAIQTALAQQPQVASAALQLQTLLRQTQQQSGPRGPCQIASLVSAPRSDGSFSSFHLKLLVLGSWLPSPTQAHSLLLLQLNCHVDMWIQRSGDGYPERVQIRVCSKWNLLLNDQRGQRLSCYRPPSIITGIFQMNVE